MDHSRTGAVPVSERGAITAELVLSTSTALFAERGYWGTTMRALADRAQLPLSAFYYYYRRKYDVLLAIMDTAMGRLEDGVAQAAAGDAEPPDRLRRLVARHVQIHLDFPAAARVADTELRSLLPSDRAAIVRRRDAYERRFRDVLADGARSGHFARDLDVPTAAMTILTMSTSVIDWWRPAGRHSSDETAALIGRYAVKLAAR